VAVDIEAPDTALAETVTELWVALAEGQRAHGSHLLAEANRTRVREAVVRHAVSDTLLVARTDEVVGFVTFDTEGGHYEQDCTRGVVQNLYVVPGHRGEGVGARLLAAAEQRLAARGADTVALEVMADNEAARRFYRREGYTPHRVELEKRVESDSKGER
jgi:ribosomal protein S18 acetylase RimI-like enzyme